VVIGQCESVGEFDSALRNYRAGPRLLADNVTMCRSLAGQHSTVKRRVGTAYTAVADLEISEGGETEGVWAYGRFFCICELGRGHN